jgi:hypothetical protein
MTLASWPKKTPRRHNALGSHCKGAAIWGVRAEGNPKQHRSPDNPPRLPRSDGVQMMPRKAIDHGIGDRGDSRTMIKRVQLRARPRWRTDLLAEDVFYASWVWAIVRRGQPLSLSSTSSLIILIQSALSSKLAIVTSPWPPLGFTLLAGYMVSPPFSVISAAATSSFTSGCG